MNVKRYSKALIYLGLLLFQKGEKQRGLRLIRQGLTANPGVIPTLQHGPPVAQRLLKAVQCKAGKARNASIEVNTRSPSAEVYINNRMVGFGKKVKVSNLPAGKYFVRVVQDGMRNWGKSVLVRANATKRVWSRPRRSPRFYYFQDLCKKLVAFKSDEAEKILDELKRISYKIQMKQIFIGCFYPTTGDAGSLKWFMLKKQQKASNGNMNISGNLERRVRLLAKLSKEMGIPMSNPTVPSFSQFSVPATTETCEEPSKISLSSAAAVKKHWNHSVGENIVVYTKFGFRMQGKVLAIQGKVLTLEVSKRGKASAILKKIKVNKTVVRSSWMLDTKFDSGYRAGERLIVITRYGIKVSGVLVKDDGDKIRIKTKEGTGNIAWKTISRVIRRDR